MRMLQTSRIFSSNLTIKMCQRDAWGPNKEQLKACKSEELEGILPGVLENSQSRNGGVWSRLSYGRIRTGSEGSSGWPLSLNKSQNWLEIREASKYARLHQNSKIPIIIHPHCHHHCHPHS